MWRIRDRSTFAALRASGRRARRGPLTITFLAASDDDPVVPRVAFAIGRRVGGAVERNRLRRRLRAVLGEQGPPVRPGAYLVAAGPEAASLSHEELRELVNETLEAVTSPAAAAGRAG